MVDIYSPYEKIYDFWGESSIDDVPMKLRDYLLLFPCEKCMNPITTNDNPRARLVKYLYYDGANPLNEEMPTVAQRKSIVFDPFNPTEPKTDKGYRVFSQALTEQIQYEGTTILRIIMDRKIPKDPYTVAISVQFFILTNSTLEANTRTTAINRVYSIENAIIESLNGVNIDGVGAFMFDRNLHSDCGSDWITDERHSIGRILTMAFESKGGSKFYNEYQ